MGEVVNLNSRALTPEQALTAALRETDVTHAYIVLVHEDGEFDLRASGDLSKLPSAAVFMGDYAVKYVKGLVEVE